ncbi:MAG: aminotransferase class I/II-fold pyridoxal phosphate-dependent enzyme [Longimicrobiales bacterium]|nr:aminotransferase class I/II-fold pyridoxal phosphate-dependent enzyme [Longimicrobiales bacterium]
MPDVHPRFDDFPPYPLADVPRLRRQLEAEGVDIIDLGAGDADLAPPPQAVAALKAAADDPALGRYGFQLGHVPLREALAGWMRDRFGVAVDPAEELLPLLGSKEGIAHLALCFVGPGDATVVPDPGYHPYRGGTLLAGGEPHLVPLRPEHGFLIPFDEIPEDVAARTRIVYLNYPNNPTAAVAPRDYLEEAVAWCRRRNAVLCFDNAYSEIAFDGYRPPSILEIDGARDVAVEFHSFSKTYNMTGWRVGWAVGCAPIIAALKRVKTFIDTGHFMAVQEGARAAVAAHGAWVPENVATFRRRRDAAASALRRAGFDVRPPRATLYLWIPVPGDEPSESFARRALEEEGVVVLPGGALGAGGEGFFRIALTTAEDRLVEAAARLGRVARSQG